MAVMLRTSYDQCRAITLRAGTSFAAGMRLFPSDRRDSVYALYAFFRKTDDLVDDPAADEQKQRALESWREQVSAALGGGGIEPGSELLALADTARRHRLPQRLFDDCIDACASDIGPVRIQTWDELLHYCDGVAGTVGEACCRVLGYAGEAALDLSLHNARGVQLTNILRDIDEDQERDRIYLPAEVLARHGVAEEDLVRRHLPRVQAALHEVADQALYHYRRSDGLFWLLRPPDRPGLAAMTLRYRRILSRLLAEGFDSAVGKVRPGQALELMCSAQMARWMPTWRGPL